MPITQGSALPEATLMIIGDGGPEPVSIADKAKDRKVVIFGLPGAYTGTCSTAHLPSFIRTKEEFAAKGVDEIVCVSVNDPFVMQAWGDATGAAEAGITMLADTQSELTKGLGVEFSAPPIGFFDRSQRYAMLVENGTVSLFHLEENPGVCEVSAGESLLAAM